MYYVSGAVLNSPHGGKPTCTIALSPLNKQIKKLLLNIKQMHMGTPDTKQMQMGDHSFDFKAVSRGTIET